MRLREKALFAASPERVWSLLTDWERQASWMPDVAWIRLMGPGRGLGARLDVKTRVFGVPLAVDRVTVTLWEPPLLLAIEHVGLVSGTGEWRLESSGTQTRFTWTEEISMPPPFLGELALEVYYPWQSWMLRRSVTNLKRLVESHATISAA